MIEESLKRYNPLELSVEEVGFYLQRIPKDTFEALCFAMPKSIQNARVLFWIVKESVNNTYTVGKQEEQPVSVMAQDLGDRLGILRPNIMRALKQLQNDGWIKKGDRKGNIYTYYVHYPKVVRALTEYKGRFTPTKKKVASSVTRERFRRSVSS